MLVEKLPNGVDYELKRLYYDIAVSGHRPAIAALTSFVPTTSDFYLAATFHTDRLAKPPIACLA